MQITSTTQPPREFFRERDKSELEWLAVTLSKGTGLLATNHKDATP